MSYLSLLTNYCTIQRVTDTNTDGRIVKSWSDSTTNQRCLLQEGKGAVRSLEAGLAVEADAVLFLPLNADIQPRKQGETPDRIIMTKPNTQATFSVTAVLDTSGQDHHLLALLKRTPNK